ncbi:MAG: histidinol phosphate phosphatase [Betaproteobacteria bacterium]|nr:MAG: histidinol phosphate phosphatase [Betaproteobacteria bacterium]
MNNLAEFRAFAETLAELARPIARRYFRSDLTVIDKPDATPVTLADMEIESAIRAEIARVYPSHGVLGEEHESTNLGADWVWVIDPIDGTKAFTCGKPQFGTLIALTHHGEPVVGVVDQAIIGERWIGARGLGATFNGAPIRTKARAKTLTDAIVLTTSPDIFVGDNRTSFERLKRACKGVYYGGDCYNFALLAAGHVDLVVEAGLKTVDFAALVNPIIEAGGVCCDWRGEPLTLTSDGTIIAAANQALADEVLAALAPSPAGGREFG